MSLPIFWRLILGYSAILLLSTSISSYSIIQLGRLSGAAEMALNTETRLISYQEQLTDAFLSEVRYAGKFIITHASPLHDQFVQFNEDFVRYLEKLKALTESAEIKARLARVEEYHLRYHDLFNQEVQYLKARQPYAETRYREEKEKILESTLRELDSLKAQLQTELEYKLQAIDNAARRSRTIAVAVTLLLVVIGMALSFSISRGIVRPLAAFKTVAEALDHQSPYKAEVSKIPELHDLALALDSARAKLQHAATVNADFLRTLNDQFIIPLLSIQRRVSYLQAQLREIVSPEEKKQMEVVNQELSRVVEGLAQLPTASRQLMVPAARIRLQQGDAMRQRSRFFSQYTRLVEATKCFTKVLSSWVRRGNRESISSRESITMLKGGKARR